MSSNTSYRKRLKKYKKYNKNLGLGLSKTGLCNVKDMEVLNKDTESVNGSLITKGIKLTSTIESRMVNEARVQSEIYRKLSNDDVEVGVEVRLGRSRCDLVIVKDGYVKCAIEVKKKKRQHFNKDTTQYIKYKKLGIPVIYCLGMENVENTVEKVKRDMLQDDVIVDLTMFN